MEGKGSKCRESCSVWRQRLVNHLILKKLNLKLLGSEWTKFGLFVPTNISQPQSPDNFLLLAMHEGKEIRELIEQSSAMLFAFANSLIENGGMEVDLGAGTIFVKIQVLFVSDLKMLPLVFGVNHSSSTNFCPICFVKRGDHRKEASSGQLRDPTMDDQINPTLLNISVENFVCPPLHLLQGCTNKVLETMDKQK